MATPQEKVSKKVFTREEVFNQLHEIADCNLKHLFTVPVYAMEAVEAALQKGKDPSALIRIHDQATDLARRALSLLLPDGDCIAKIPEAWQAIGWLNGAEEHMIQKHEKYTLKETPCPEIQAFVDALPELMHATRMVRRNLEKTLFDSIEKTYQKQNKSENK
jgi:hypothetical protein